MWKAWQKTENREERAPKEAFFKSLDCIGEIIFCQQNKQGIYVFLLSHDIHNKNRDLL